MRRFPIAAIAAIALLLTSSSCGDPYTPRAGTPTLDDPVVGAATVVAVGGEHSCALANGGDAWCWGANEFGQVGVALGATVCARFDRKIPCEPTPRAVSGGLKFQRIAAGNAHSCGLLTDGRIYCWGDNQHGQLGDPSVAYATSPRLVQTTSLFADVVAGATHTCGLRTDGVALCWGGNEMGQLGNNSGGIGSAIPVTVATNQRFASLSAGDSRTCGRTAAGAPFCWGSHWVARAINGTEITRLQTQPASVSLSPTFSQISVGGQATCGLTLAGAAWCWEANPTGAIGDGSTVGSTTPIHVDTGLRFTSISAGAVATCGVSDSGDAYCWGSGEFGQLGVSWTTLTARCIGGVPCALRPNRASGWRDYAAIAAGVGEHMCGLTLGGSVYCWGSGSMGQRGDGTVNSTWSPTRVPLP